MGIERIEPAIPRKDIDRRIYVLRREKIRNTAKRFKLQTIISRYNTFQQYWQRICREIENGTYKRHVIKAERIAPGQLLTVAARKRLGRAALEAMEPDASAAESSPPRQNRYLPQSRVLVLRRLQPRLRKRRLPRCKLLQPPHLPHLRPDRQLRARLPLQRRALRHPRRPPRRHRHHRSPPLAPHRQRDPHSRASTSTWTSWVIGIRAPPSAPAKVQHVPSASRSRGR